MRSSENPIGAVNQQERLDLVENPQRPYAEHREAVKIWSDLHGDMQSQAEMTWPPTEALRPRRR
jgi:hypothetical protein